MKVTLQGWISRWYGDYCSGCTSQASGRNSSRSVQSTRSMVHRSFSRTYVSGGKLTRSYPASSSHNGIRFFSSTSGREVSSSSSRT